MFYNYLLFALGSAAPSPLDAAHTFWAHLHSWGIGLGHREFSLTCAKISSKIIRGRYTVEAQGLLEMGGWNSLMQTRQESLLKSLLLLKVEQYSSLYLSRYCKETLDKN